jgi:hypothetical protein
LVIISSLNLNIAIPDQVREGPVGTTAAGIGAGTGAGAGSTFSGAGADAEVVSAAMTKPHTKSMHNSELIVRMQPPSV